jgi:1-acyl-sn-glycerol-3-phosphate acyltransferase
MGLKLTWIGKESLFRGFTGATLGRLMRLWGGRPVNRHHASGAVEQWAQLIEGEPWCWLTLSPEGTRKHQDHLRTGFYHLALRTRLPVGLGYIDYGRRQVGVSRFVQMSGDEDRDLALLSDYYGDRRGLRPGNAATIRFRPRK